MIGKRGKFIAVESDAQQVGFMDPLRWAIYSGTVIFIVFSILLLIWAGAFKLDTPATTQGPTPSPAVSGPQAKANTESPPSPAVQLSVVPWIVAQQEIDGHWDATKWGGTREQNVGITGLVLLSLAGAGHNERSGKYKGVVSKAINWLAQQQDDKGSFAPKETMYSHAIVTLALLQEVDMCPVPATKAIAKRGLDYMLSVQTKQGAWGDKPNESDNTSVTAWCVMALKTARVAGFDVPKDAWAGVSSYLDSVTDPDTGEVGYTMRPNKDASTPSYQKYSMTACGMLCRLYTGTPREDRLIRNGALILMENLPEWNQPGLDAPFYYYWYFGTLVMFQLEGDSWRKWNSKKRDMLVSHQDNTPGELKGSWDPSSKPDVTGFSGRVYSTAMAMLTLEIYYRYEIISKTGTSEKH